MPATEAAGEDRWRPGATPETLRLRAGLLARVREFFASRGVLEVDTPLLSRYAGTDPAIEPMPSRYQGPGSAQEQPLYLQSSPEFFMKRLLAAGSGAVYQLAHVMRDGELGRRHNPEFMLLEWYRPGYDCAALMDELEALLAFVLEHHLAVRPARRLSYRQWFIEGTGLDPWRDDVEAFRAFAEQRLGGVPAGLDPDRHGPWLDLLVTHWLEPRLEEGAVFICDYPPEQAALARIRHDEVPVAERFELYFNGVELANGFHELADAGQQRQRFEQENRQREQAGQKPLPIDERLLAALACGLPDCSGVAVGFDRLVMLAAGLTDIATAMPFDFSRV